MRCPFVRFASVAGALALFAFPAPAASAASVSSREGAREPSCREGETPEYFRARYQWYIERYGVNGVFNPELRLQQVREAYAEYRRDVAAGRLQAEPLAAANPGTFKFLGPVNGAGRATAIEPHPTDPGIVYVGAAGGGCWKSTDGGTTWRVLTDGLGDLSVGAVAVAPSNPGIVYLGTGEGGYAGDFIPGIGFFKSTDAGATWQVPSSVLAPLIYRISVDPRDAAKVLAFTSNGVQRSTDGGATFARTGDPSWLDATDVARDPSNPDVLHATFWGFRSSPETGRYAKSTDNGATWAEKTTGLPAGKGRTSVAVSSDGRFVYTFISGTQQALFPQIGVYQSTDGGETWAKKLGATPNILTNQGWYDNTVAVDPDNANAILLGGGGQGLFRSANAGTTVTNVTGNGNVHVDHHQLLFKKYGSTKIAWTANDGGVWSSTDGGVNWTDRNAGLGTRQYYSVAIDPTRPNVVVAGAQDNGTGRRQDNDTNQFDVVGFGDGFEAAIDPDSPQTFYVSSQYATISRYTSDTSYPWYVAQSFAGPPYSSSGGDGVKPFYSFITLEPGNPKTVYTGTYRIWRSEDAGETWSPLNSDNFQATRPAYGLAVAKGNPDRLLAAQSNRILVSSDHGNSFTNLSTGSNGLPTSGLTFKNVEIDPRNADVFYVSTTSTSSGTVFKSADAGASWTRSDSGLPSFGVEVVRVDPGDSNTLYAGTLVGLYRSVNAGATWNRFGDGFPAAAVHEIRITPDGARVVVATHGRGVWAADGLSANRSPVVAISAPAGGKITIGPGQSVSFAGSATDPDGDAVALRWDLGDGMHATGGSPVVVYRTPGVYVVTLIGEDGKGGRGGAFATVTVRPSNDACAGALPLALVPDATVVYRTGNGGTTVSDPSDPPTCSKPDISNSVWFTFTPPADGSIDLDTFGSLGDTVLALYDTPCGVSSAAVDCNDDATDVSGGPSQLKTNTVTAGKTYRILVASWSDPDNAFVFAADSLRLRALYKPNAADTPSAGTSVILPVVLDAYGKNGARFQSDFLALNRGTSPLTLAVTYGGPVGGTGESTATLVVPAGAQLRAPDALAELRREGIVVAKTTPSASQIGSLSALVTSGDPASLVLASRTASPNPNSSVGGTFGLFSAGTAFADAADSEAVYVYGLRQTDRDRANLALVHVRSPHARSATDASITLAVDVFDASGAAAPAAIGNVTLQPGEWRQLNEILSAAGLNSGSADGGYVRVRRVAGTGRFVVYGVVNDQKTADGSFVAMTKAGELKASDTVLVPIVLEAGGVGGSFFTSELVVANRSARSGTVTLRYAASPQLGGAGSGSAPLTLGPGSQKVIPGFLQFLRSNGLAIPSTGAQGGSLSLTFSGFDPSDDVYAGVRTSTPNPDAGQGGSFGVFSPGVGAAGLAAGSAVVGGLRQDNQVRSNLAVVNGGNDLIALSVQLHAAADGAAIGSPLTKTLSPGEWYQWSNVFATAGVSSGEGYAVVTRASGSAAWYAYGVLNDAATSDGSVIVPVR